VAISVNPSEDRTYDDPLFDPLWSAAQDSGLPISLHILTARKYKPDAGIDKLANTITQAIHIQHALVRMIFSGVLHRFPGLTVISAENDIGWAAHLLERMDYIFERRRASLPKDVPWDLAPSDLFRRSVHLTFMRDRAGVVARDAIGVDNIMWASDYPHTDSTWPNSQKMIERLCEGIPDEDRHKIVMANAARMYAFN
jgi:predicted TIM-barrel fold metal-dependent hydrolase